jgi:DNA-directed RNA polymerase subunit RPC12/RpoP
MNKREVRQQTRQERRAARRAQKQAGEPAKDALGGVFFLLGLAYIAYTGSWWPGILVLVALTALVEWLIGALFPASAAASTPPTPPAVGTPAPVATFPFERLPSECAKCGAPVRPHDVRWQAAPDGGPAAADCPYCGAKLPLA